MLKDDVTLRIAREEDAGELLAIYAPYVEKTAVSFEYEAPTVEEFRGRICRIRERYPYLVAEAGGEILGYAYASAFHERKAFDHAVATRWRCRSTCGRTEGAAAWEDGFTRRWSVS